MTAFPTPMSAAQAENLVRDNIERMSEDPDLSWLPDVADDLSNVEIGSWRCVQEDEVHCENSGLWESPLEWEPECGYCGRKALLVEVVGCFDYST